MTNNPAKKEIRPWWEEAGGLCFSCLPGCRRCCGGEPGDVWLTAVEEKKIAARLELSLEEFRAAYVRTSGSGRVSLRERFDGDCVLLGDKGCAVYSVRPRQCRTYPFWPEVLESPETWEEERGRCPGCGEGRLYSPEEITALLRGRGKTG